MTMSHENAQQHQTTSDLKQNLATPLSQPGILETLTAAERAFIDRKLANGEVLTDQQIALGIRQLREIGALD